MATTTQQTLTFSSIAERLDAAGLDYTRLDRGTTQEAIEVPGYGTIWYDDRDGVEAGWVVRLSEERPGDEDIPTDESSLIRDLDEIAGFARAIQ